MTIKELLALLPEEQRAEAEKAIDSLNPLHGIETASQAVEFIKQNSVLKRGLDSIESRAVEAYKTRFEEEKLPDLKKALRDEIAKELNPQETPEQKRLRELEEKLADKERNEKLYQLRNNLRAKAKELGVDEDIAEKFAYLQTDDHEAELTWFAEKFQTSVKSLADQEINQRWPKGAPKATMQGGGKITDISQVPDHWTPADYAKALEKGIVQYGDE